MTVAQSERAQAAGGLASPPKSSRQHKGEITVEFKTEERGGRMEEVLVIYDNGCGMSEQVLDSAIK